MQIESASSSSASAAIAAQDIVGKIAPKLDPAVVKLVFVFASTTQEFGPLMGALDDAFRNAVVVGATTSGEFTEQHNGKGTCVAIAIAGELSVKAGFARGLATNTEDAVNQAVSALPTSPEPGYSHRTGVVFVDPLSGHGEEAALLTSLLLGADVPLAGGAAGDDLKMNCAMVGLGGEVATDAIVVAHLSSKVPLAVGVSHGHLPISPPLTVTKAVGSRVYEVDGKPAWDVWKENTREAAKKQGIDVDRLSPEEESGYLLRYEAGLAMGDAWKVRAPLSRDPDGSLLLATAVPQEAVIRITESTVPRQIDSARAAAERARDQLHGQPCAGVVVFDCICRNLILGPQFTSAIDAIGDVLGHPPLAGLETYGEIALNTEDLSAFHNTTTVLLAFPKAQK